VLTVSLSDALAADLTFDVLMRRCSRRSADAASDPVRRGHWTFSWPARARRTAAAGRRADWLRGHYDPGRHSGPAAGRTRRPGRGAVNVPAPTHEERAEYWRACLAAAGEPVSDPALQQLAGRFRLAPEQIADAVALARSSARLPLGGAVAPPAARTLEGSSCASCSPPLAPVRSRARGLAHKIERYTTGRRSCCPTTRSRNCTSCASRSCTGARCSTNGGSAAGSRSAKA